MATDSLEDNLAKFKRVLLIWVGVVATLLAVAIADIPNMHSPYLTGWFGVWLIIQMGTISPSIMLLFGSGFRKLPFPERLNTIFAYFIVSWIALVAFAIKSGSFLSMHISTYFGFAYPIGISITLMQLYEFVGIIGASIGIAYWILQRKYIISPEAKFP